ncbi:MAG: hydroxymethylpyrimidine/phosphomethylpyrimidine kinase [Muribaculaceae bacterium]|nr:hydroxymethylpyrimidine/phosphomethylpyrimidine kinase [Muribaculaceae bacterium]
MKKDKIILLVGGTDCTGGAGLAADIGVVRTLQCYPMPVVSCITSQGPEGFRRMQEADIEIFTDQLVAVLKNVRPDAVKVGMLPSARHMAVLAMLLSENEHGPVVFDPVMKPTDGAENFSADWWEDPGAFAYFLTQVDLITPNYPELLRLIKPAEELYGSDIPEQFAAMGSLAKYIYHLNLLRRFYDVPAVLLTGGHNEDNRYTDILMHDPSPEDNEPKDVYHVEMLGGEGVDTPNTHGTGCVYSTAIASLLAQDLDLNVALPLAKRLMYIFLDGGKNWRLFKSGHGPAFSILNMPESPGDGLNPMFGNTPGFMN